MYTIITSESEEEDENDFTILDFSDPKEKQNATK